MIPYGRQNISQDDIDQVIDVLKSDFLTQGPKVPQFESTLCAYTGSNYSVAVNSATSALHIACRALGLTEGDWLWTSPITFVASANCGLFCGAQVDFVDINPNTYNLCVDALVVKLKSAKKKNRLPKIVIPVHLCGQSCDMEAIFALSKEYGFQIIEDASHAIGGKYKKESVGSCRYSAITVFSFHPVKIITTGEGGIAMTNSLELANKMELFRSHGITRAPELLHNESDGPWYYEQIDLGYNYRMTDLQAALGLSQFTRLDQFIQARHRRARIYDTLLNDLPIVLPFQASDAYSAYHLYVIRLKLNEISKTRKEVFQMLREVDIGVNLHYIPVYKQPYYQALGFTKDYCSNAEAYYSEAVSLPMYPDLTEDNQVYIANRLRDILTS